MSPHELIERAAKGEPFVIAKAGKPVARLGPLAGSRQKRRLGALAGKLQITKDFDEPLPDEVVETFEGR